MFCPTLEIRTYDHEYSMFVILVFEVRKSKLIQRKRDEMDWATGHIGPSNNAHAQEGS